MPTVSMEEASRNLPELVHKLDVEPILIVDGDKEVAIVTAPAGAELTRQQQWDEFWKKRDKFAAEFAANLAKDGLTVEEFLSDLLTRG